jgi:diaminopropionate ammonia-lyase
MRDATPMPQLLTVDLSFPPPAGSPLAACVHDGARQMAQGDIPRWTGYEPTPLLSLPSLAAALGLGSVATKYEAGRFGLGSFKALGGAFGVAALLADLSAQDRKAATVVTASDGNHGLSVAWGARRAGCACRIYLHENVAESRADLIRAQGAQIVRVAGNYDDSTHRAKSDALIHGWHLVSDTALSPDDLAPAYVMAGYTVMMDEIIAQTGKAIPTHVFIQGGCGGLAAAAFGVLHEAWGQQARFVIVEPDKADCLFQSARAGNPVRIEGDLDTVMGGLSVGEVSLTAWETIRATTRDFLTIADDDAIITMAGLGRGIWGDPPLVVGDAGSAGLAGLIAAAQDPQIRAALGLYAGSRVLTIVTEGAVDAPGYQRLTGLDPAQVSA